jgi:hypothetical protein
MPLVMILKPGNRHWDLERALSTGGLPASSGTHRFLQTRRMRWILQSVSTVLSSCMTLKILKYILSETSDEVVLRLKVTLTL